MHPTMNPVDFTLRGEHITLEALIKACGLTLGGSAKPLIASGAARVNGEPETRRGRKLHAGDEVQVGESRLRVQAPPLDSRPTAV